MMKRPDYVGDLRRLAVHAGQAFQVVGAVYPKKDIVLEAIMRKHRKRVMQQWQEAGAHDT